MTREDEQRRALEQDNLNLRQALEDSLNGTITWLDKWVNEPGHGDGKYQFGYSRLNHSGNGLFLTLYRSPGRADSVTVRLVADMEALFHENAVNEFQRLSESAVKEARRQEDSARNTGQARGRRHKENE